MNIIGICGRAGAGKTTAGEVLVKNFGFVAVSLADPLKRICKEVFQFTDEQLWGPSEKRNEPDKRFPNSFSSANEGRWPQGWLTPRYALQRLGTEWGRDCYPDVWVDYAMRVAKRLLDDNAASAHNGCLYSAKSGLVYMNTDECPAGVVIPDVRFPNEVDVIRAVGGRIWKINRWNDVNSDAWRKHVSEAHVDDIKSDVTIDNDADVEAFRASIAFAYDARNSPVNRYSAAVFR